MFKKKLIAVLRKESAGGRCLKTHLPLLLQILSRKLVHGMEIAIPAALTGTAQQHPSSGYNPQPASGTGCMPAPLLLQYRL